MLRPLLLNNYVRGLPRLAAVLKVGYARDRARDSGRGGEAQFRSTRAQRML